MRMHRWSVWGVAAFLLGCAHVPVDRLEVDVVRAEDIRTIKKLQHAYGYYADRGLWNDLADLFADDAIADYPSGIFDGKASIRAMFIENLGQGKQGLAEGRIYNHTILQPVVDLSVDGAAATGRWRVLGMLGRFGGSATWADSLYRFDYVKRDGRWKIKSLIAYAGSGGSYAEGWAPPKPRPAGFVDTSPVRFNLAHPADRPRSQPCDDDATVCVVPFPYANRSGIRQAVQPEAVVNASASQSADERVADLVRRAQRLEDEHSVLNLQHAYGYYIDRGQWQQAADLFAQDGTLEVGQAGVYVGRTRVRSALAMAAPQGLRTGQRHDHLQFEPVISVAADGRTARGRIFELAFVGGGGLPARIVQSVQENAYVRLGSTWKFQSMHSYTILATDYEQGWAKSALPADAVSQALPPDRPPSVVYEAYPKVYTPLLHFGNPSAGAPINAAAASALRSPSATEISTAARKAQRALDHDEIENLQNAYGYYAEKSLWSDMAGLFADDGTIVIDGVPHRGRERILAVLRASGTEGPVKGVLNSQLQLQPVIDVAANGRTARIRSRVLQLTRDAQGLPMWGAGLYENEFVREEGVWKIRRLHLQRTWSAYYKGGWSAQRTVD